MPIVESFCPRAVVCARLLLLAFGAANAAASADTVVITNLKGPDSISREQLSDIFLGKSSSLPGGVAAAPIDQPDSSTVREEFYLKVTGKSSAQVKAYWAKLMFTGKGTPPKVAVYGAEIKKLVAASPGGVAYIDKAAVDSSVKVVYTLP